MIIMIMCSGLANKQTLLQFWLLEVKAAYHHSISTTTVTTMTTTINTSGALSVAGLRDPSLSLGSHI